MVLLRNAAWNYAGTFVEGLLGLAIVAYVTRHLGMTEYGVLLLALTVAELLVLLDLGLLSVLTQGLIAEQERAGAAAFSRLAGAAFFACAGLGVLTALLLAAGAVAWRASGLAPAFEAHVSFIAWTAGGVALFALPAHAGARAHEAVQGYRVLGRTNIVLAVLRALAVVVVLGAGGDVVGLGAVYVAHAAARLLVLAGALFHRGDPMTPAWRRPDWSRLRQVWRPGGWAVLDNVGNQLAFGLDTLVLGAFSTMAAVAVFGVGRRIPVSLWLVVEKSVAVMLPVFARHHASGDSAALGDLFERTCRTTVAILLPVIVLSAAFAGVIIELWVGASYANSVVPMRWLLMATLVLALSVPSITLLHATGRISISARVAVVDGLANLGLSLLLVRPYGAAGVAAATALTHFTFTASWLLPAACRVAGIGTLDLARLIVRDTFRPTVALLSAVALALAWLGTDSIPAAVRYIGACFAVGVFMLLWRRSDIVGNRRLFPAAPTREQPRGS